jgi:hypothetical protein
MTAPRDAPHSAPTVANKPWLVERTDWSTPHWWAIPYGWTEDPDQAMQFARGIDAQAFIDFFGLNRVALATDRPATAPRPGGRSEAVEAAQRRETLERIRLMAEGVPGDNVYDPDIYVSPGTTFYADMRLIYAAVVTQIGAVQQGGVWEVPSALTREVAQIIFGAEPLNKQPDTVQIKMMGRAKSAIEAVRRSLVTGIVN